MWWFLGFFGWFLFCFGFGFVLITVQKEPAISHSDFHSSIRYFKYFTHFDYIQKSACVLLDLLIVKILYPKYTK